MTGDNSRIRKTLERARSVQLAKMGKHAKIFHKSVGDPCAFCHEPGERHIGFVPDNAWRTKAKVNPIFRHKSIGDPCTYCGKPADHVDHYRTPHRPFLQPFKETHTYFGIDGEGVGRPIHRYVLLAYSDHTGKRQGYVENMKGLRTVECLEFLLDIEEAKGRLFAYAFNYDITKILEDLDNKALWYLARPERRQRFWPSERKRGPLPVEWGGYKLNYQGSKFTIEHPKTERRMVIWDTFRFYGKPFVETLQDWSVGNAELWDRMQTMKNKRAGFDQESMADVRRYCLEECQCMGDLTRRLVKAHDVTGLRLTSFYGAGSTATALLKTMKIKEKIRQPPDEMKLAVAMSYFGGRFENSRIGVIQKPVDSRDISSAYPYQIAFLPCLEHGEWVFSKNREDLENHFALVNYKLELIDADEPWAPFPHRDRTGSIWYPRNATGWVWNQEYLAGERLFPNHTKFLGAWIFRKVCDCKPPFSEIPAYYKERIRIGKEGPGYVLKLGPNSVYGKLVQSIGNPEFQCWVWGASITSGCRAQLLDAMHCHEDRRNLLAVATDGILTLEQGLELPKPRDTDTWTAINPKGETVRKPLGGWELDKSFSDGLFLARPGVLFPVNATEDDIKKIRARGFGRGNILKNYPKIREAWDNSRITAEVVIKDIPRFCGFKNSIHRMVRVNKETGKREEEFSRYQPNFPEWGERSYGQWVTRNDIMTFDPMPKRSGVASDGETLKLRTSSGVSAAYGKGSARAAKKVVQDAFKEFREDAHSQPDGYFADDFESD